MIGLVLNQDAIRKRVITSELGRNEGEDEIPFLCRFEDKTVRIPTADGERIQVRIRIFADRDADIIQGDEISIEGISGTGLFPESWPVKAVITEHTFVVSHLEILV